LISGLKRPVVSISDTSPRRLKLSLAALEAGRFPKR